jgi:uncharacterized protein (DUF885 family)
LSDVDLRRFCAVLVLALAALAACDRGTVPRPAATAGQETARMAAKSAREGQRLRDITERYYEQYLELHPLAATAQGDHRFDDRFGDYASEGWLADWLAVEQEALQALSGIDAAKLKGEDLVTFESFRYGRQIAIEGFRYQSELLPLSQFDGLHLQFALLGSGRGMQPFITVRDYEDFLGRMEGYVAWTDQVITNLRAGSSRGYLLPRVVVERVIAQLAELGVADPEQSVFWQPVASFPAGVSAADQQRLAQAYGGKLASQVLPAYRRLHDYLEKEYLPLARDSVGWSELPNGGEWYAYLVREYTTTSLTPDEIHEIGIKEVARLHQQMERSARQLGHQGDLRSFLHSLRSDPRQHFTDAADLLAGYEAIRSRVSRSMPLLFARIPATRFQIRPFEDFQAATQAAAAYRPGSPDGRRPGVLYVNTRDMASRPKYLMESLYLHEAVPGHHYQMSLARENTELPRFRRFAYDAAFSDGWALYAESLGADLGLYTDEYSRFGAQTAEAWRAAMIVVDTGLHSRGWTSNQALDYLRANTALGEADIVAAVERCIVEPAQALSDEVGQLRITELRRRAQSALGPRFDVRAFHEEVVGSGSLPLPVLEAKVDRWIAARQ